MKATELVEPYFKSLGLRFISGDENSYEPLMIFLLHDMVFQKVTNEIRKIPFTHEEKRIRNAWVKELTFQFKKFFINMDDERQDTIIDLMDELTEYISNDIMILKCATMDCVNWMSFEDQMNLSDIQVVSILTQISQVHWEGMIRARDRDCSKLLFDSISRNYAMRLSSYYAKKYKRVVDNDCKQMKKLIDVVGSLDTKICNWVVKKTRDEVHSD